MIKFVIQIGGRWHANDQKIVEQIIVKQRSIKKMNISFMQVGKRCPQYAGPEGTKFDINDSGAVFIVRFHRPTPQEIESFQSGEPLDIRMTVINNIIYMLFKFGNLHWMDAPYSAHLSLNLSHLDPIPEGHGMAMTIVLCDTDGTIRHIRFISMTHDFSVALRNAIHQQANTDFDYFKHNEEINRVFSAYSTKDLVKMSCCRMKL